MEAPIFNNNTTISELLDVLRNLSDEDRLEFYHGLDISLELAIQRVSADFLPLVDRSLLIGIPRRGHSSQRSMTVRFSPLNYWKPKGKSLTSLSSAEAPMEGGNEAGQAETEDSDDDQDVIDVSEGEGDFTGYGEEEEEDAEMGDEEPKAEAEEDEEPEDAPSHGRSEYRGSNIHFSKLLTMGVIVPGNHLAIPTADNSGVLATMVVRLPSLALYRQYTNNYSVRPPQRTRFHVERGLPVAQYLRTIKRHRARGMDEGAAAAWYHTVCISSQNLTPWRQH